MQKLDSSLFHLKALTPDIDVSGFSCVETDLNNYLTDEALRDQKYLFSTTHLMYYDEKLVGYFALVGDTINPERIDDEISIKYEYARLPALKIARLAVDENYAGMGVGSLMLSHIYTMAINLTKTAGFRVISVDSKKNAQTFYEHFQFKKAKYGGNHETILMYIDIKPLLEYTE